MTRYKNDRHVNPLATDQFLQFKASEIRKRHVEHQAAWAGGSRTLKKILCRCKRLGFPSGEFDQQLQRFNTTIAQYTIVSKIGEGGMGEVYRTRDTKLRRDVAIKVLPASLSENADRLNRFEHEVQAISFRLARFCTKCFPASARFVATQWPKR